MDAIAQELVDKILTQRHDNAQQVDDLIKCLCPSK